MRIDDVDINDGRLVVEPHSPSLAAAQDRRAFVTTTNQGSGTRPTLTLTASLGYMLLIKNGSAYYDWLIDRISFYSSGANSIAYVDLNPAIGTLANNVSDQIFCKTAGSAHKPDSGYLAEAWDETGAGMTGITENQLIYQWNAAGTNWEWVPTGLILPAGTALGIAAQDSSTGEFGCSIEISEVRI